MENDESPAVVQPGIVPQPPPPSFPLWSKWIDSKNRLWVIVNRLEYAMVEGRYTATTLGCLDVSKEYVFPYSVAQLTDMVQQGRLTRLETAVEVDIELPSTPSHDAQTP